MNNIYYVYMYLRDDLTPYYIGKGKNRRAFLKAINHHPPKDKSFIFFVKKNINEQDALYWEEYYIKEYGRKDNGTSILRNLTDGGLGTIRHIRKQFIIDNQSFSWWIKYKNEKQKLVKNLRYFCRIHNLDQSTMRRLANGEGIQHKGYQCRYENNFFDFYSDDIFKEVIHIFKSPEGVLFEVSKLREFSREHKLDHSCLSKLIYKKLKQYRKWIFMGEK